MNSKEITVVFYGRRFPRSDWRVDLDQPAMDRLLADLGQELEPLGVRLRGEKDGQVTIDVNGYGDLLNAIRIRSPRDHIVNLCLGHIIGASPNRDLLEDVRRGVNRVAFAPETIEPEGSNKIVCHNCGCGC
jgi:hypothetical protein